ncbi:hypothetical protein OO008_09140 [Cocleimonas sp. KMM 6895]|nr:hypothetical protein [Cocleimonas sp. KMM 6892]MEC4715330.1 hypothetical protein [Cocleimonas sp. KMM 6895]
MSRATRLARYPKEEKLEVSLFPFLSIFLCVMGVLSFINVLNSFSAPQKIELTAQLEQGYKVAYQIFSLPDGIISVPPVKYLDKLRDAVEGIDQVAITDILQRRQNAMFRLENHNGPVMRLATEPDVDDILQAMQDIRTLNEIALKANYLYEEFLLFGIYPNGSQAYQKIRDVMSFTQDAASISIGLEPLDANWTLNLNKNTN